MADTVDLAQEKDSKLRALWGDVRATLGCDPRFEATGLRLAKKDIEDLPTAFTTEGDEVPGFALIDARNKPFWFGDGGSHSAPPVKVPGLEKPFYMARTLTTAAQYAQFVSSPSYASHFEGEGRQWLEGSYVGPASDEDAINWLARRPKQKRNEPYEWKAQLANHLRPIVHVSWFEAQAYVKWLDASLTEHGLDGYRASLPTELQWECAARYSVDLVPSQRPFPWRDGPAADADWQDFADYANLEELVGNPTTVGLYPNGRSETGLTDIAGNVWEWMGHSYVGKYDPCVDVGLQQATKYGSLRGCSWVTIPGFARCSFRRAYHPDGWNDSIGFRVVLSLAN